MNIHSTTGWGGGGIRILPVFTVGGGTCLGWQLVRANTEQTQSEFGAHVWVTGRDLTSHAWV